MMPPSLARAATTPTVQPILGACLPPALPIPHSRALRTLERTARAYGKTHASALGYPASSVAVAALTALCRHHGLIPHPLPDGRWTTRPPSPEVSAAFARLQGTQTIAHTPAPTPTPTPAPF